MSYLQIVCLDGSVLKVLLSYFNSWSDSTCANVSQGSVLPPLLFTMCTSPKLSSLFSSVGIVRRYLGQHNSWRSWICYHKITRLFDCHLTMYDFKKVKRNPNKTEFIRFVAKLQKQKFSHLFPIVIFCEKFYPSEQVMNLGVIFDYDVSLDQHISSLCQSGFLSDLTFLADQKARESVEI